MKHRTRTLTDRFLRERERVNRQLDQLDKLAQRVAMELQSDGQTLRSSGEILGLSYSTVDRMLQGTSSPRPWASRKRKRS